MKKLQPKDFKMLVGRNALLEQADENKKVRIIGVDSDCVIVSSKNTPMQFVSANRVTPILRPLTDTTYKERQELARTEPNVLAPCIFNPTCIESNIDVRQVPLLLHKGF